MNSFDPREIEYSGIIAHNTYLNGNLGIGTSTPQDALVVTNGNLGVGTWAPVTLFDVNRKFNVLSSGNVGISTTSPQAKLAVMGNVGIGTWTADGGNLIVKGGGNVGIGTAWPGTVLDVNGTVRATAFSGSGAALTGISGTVSGLTLGYVPKATSATAIGNGALFDNGNVGIGTITPQGAFVVTSGNVGVGTVAPTSAFQIVGGGIQVGQPTGGDKGDGNINIAGDIYKNNTAYTNPDYVFEKYFTGQIVKFKNNPGASSYTGIKLIADVIDYAKEHNQLPLVSAVNGNGIFGKGDGLLASLEESYIYIFDLHKHQQVTSRELRETIEKLKINDNKLQITNDKIKTLQEEKDQLKEETVDKIKELQDEKDKEIKELKKEKDSQIKELKDRLDRLEQQR